MLGFPAGGTGGHCVKDMCQGVCQGHPKLCVSSALRLSCMPWGQQQGSGKEETIPLGSSNPELTLSWGTQDPVPSPAPTLHTAKGLTSPLGQHWEAFRLYSIPAAHF